MPNSIGPRRGSITPAPRTPDTQHEFSSTRAAPPVLQPAGGVHMGGARIREAPGAAAPVALAARGAGRRIAVAHGEAQIVAARPVVADLRHGRRQAGDERERQHADGKRQSPHARRCLPRPVCAARRDMLARRPLIVQVQHDSGRAASQNRSHLRRRIACRDPACGRASACAARVRVSATLRAACEPRTHLRRKAGVRASARAACRLRPLRRRGGGAASSRSWCWCS